MIHGNGPSKLLLDSLANYMPAAFRPSVGCTRCSLSAVVTNDQTLPEMTIALLIVKPTPYVEEFLAAVDRLDYPRSRLHLFLFNNQPYNRHLVDRWINEHRTDFASVQVANMDDTLKGELPFRSRVELITSLQTSDAPALMQSTSLSTPARLSSSPSMPMFI